MPHKRPAITPVEDGILTTIVYLAALLPLPLDAYRGIMARIRDQKLNVPGRSRGEKTSSCIDGHQPRVTQPWKTRKEYE